MKQHKKYYRWIWLLAAFLLAGQSIAGSIVKAIEDKEIEINFRLDKDDVDDNTDGGEVILAAAIVFNRHFSRSNLAVISVTISSYAHPAYLHGIRAPPLSPSA